MIGEPPDTPGQYPPSGKLVLPPYSGEPGPAPYTARTVVAPHGQMIQPGQLIQRASPPPPRNPFAMFGYFWNRDPAYKVLIVAIVMVITAGSILFVLLTNSFAQSSQTSVQSQSPQNQPDQAQKAPIATATANVQPTPSPSPVVQGDNQNNQPAPVVSTPAIIPTPTVNQSPPTNIGGPLQLQITNSPQQVNNGNTVQIGVTATHPGVRVHLQVVYDTLALPYISRTQTTDQNGNATLSWHARVQRFFSGKHSVVARITAYGQDQHGQQVTSQTISVQVNG